MTNGSRSSAGEVNSTWARWLMPSVSDLIFVAMLGLLTCTALSTRLLGDAGIGWHIRTGQMILATHAVPRVDPFSAGMSGRPWFAWEWLYDLGVGWLESVAALNGVVWFTALVIAGVFSWTFWMMLRRGTNLLVGVVLVLLAASASMIHFLARPHVLSWLFTVVWFWILDSWEKNCWGSGKTFTTEDTGVHGGLCDRARLLSLLPIWLLPVFMIVWVNVHGGFLIGFALLAIYWISAAWRWLRPVSDHFEDLLRSIRARARLRSLTAVGVLCVLATLVNPYGYRLHLHIYRYLSNRFLMDHIDEFQSPNFHYVAQKCFAGLLLLTLVALVVKRREARVSQGLVVLLAVYSGLYASRNIPVSSLLLVLVIGPWLSDAMERYAEARAGRGFGGNRERASESFVGRMASVEFSLRGHLWPIVAVVLTGWTALHGGKLGEARLMNAHFDGKRFPAKAVAYIRRATVQGRGQGPLVTPDYWGGYFIYELYPQVRMVVDDRHDFYGEEFFKSYLRMVQVQPGWQDFLQQNQARTVAVPTDSALANILKETTEWKAVYSDDVAVVFERIGAIKN